jgi:hypothetical protein
MHGRESAAQTPAIPIRIPITIWIRIRMWIRIWMRIRIGIQDQGLVDCNDEI